METLGSLWLTLLSVLEELVAGRAGIPPAMMLVPGRGIVDSRIAGGGRRIGVMGLTASKKGSELTPKASSRISAANIHTQGMRMAS